MVSSETPPRSGAGEDVPPVTPNGVHGSSAPHAPRSARVFSLFGVGASIILIALGIGSIVVGARGHSEVSTTIKQEAITGTPDMTPAGIAEAVKGTEIENIKLPTCSVADKLVASGADAKCFAEYMRIHALEGTGGRTYSQMGQYLTADGKETGDKALAAKDPKSGQPVANGARNVWVIETVLATALNTSYFAQQVGLFSIAVGIALVLIGIGFLVMMLGVLQRRVALP